MLKRGTVKLIILFSLFLSLSSFGSNPSKGVVHVFYGDLKSGQMAIINRVFKPKLKILENKKEVEKIIEWPKGKIEDFLKVIKNPKTLGVLFLGHPAIKTEGTYPDKRIIHGYLKSGDGYYLPKEILSAAHSNLQFLSIMTCHESAILPLYLDSLPNHVDVIKSPTHGLDNLDNPLFEFTSFYSTPKVIEKLEKNFDDNKYAGFFVQPLELQTIRIQYRDLVSSRFTYTVKVNDKLVGILKKETNQRGRIHNIFEKAIDLGNETINRVSIQPDDPRRPRKDGVKVVDDILLDQVELIRGNTPLNLLRKTIHLGDQMHSPDEGEGLGFLRNKKAFFKAPFRESWEIEL